MEFSNKNKYENTRVGEMSQEYIRHTVVLFILVIDDVIGAPRSKKLENEYRV